MRTAQFQGQPALMNRQKPSVIGIKKDVYEFFYSGVVKSEFFKVFQLLQVTPVFQEIRLRMGILEQYIPFLFSCKLPWLNKNYVPFPDPKAPFEPSGYPAKSVVAVKAPDLHSCPAEPLLNYAEALVSSWQLCLPYFLLQLFLLFLLLFFPAHAQKEIRCLFKCIGNRHFCAGSGISTVILTVYLQLARFSRQILPLLSWRYWAAIRQSLV